MAGSWYPRDSAQLGAELDGYVAGVQVVSPPSLIAIVAPHAGLVYSGPVAAYAYAAASARRFSAVILVGPSHFVPFEGVSIWPRGSWETPFGPVDVDRDLGAAIQARTTLVTDLPAAHGREHSLEMQLPFVARLLAGLPIVPLVMGYQTRETALALGEAMADAVTARGGDVLIVASTDLSHYEDASTAQQLDRVVLDHVGRLDARGLMDALEREPRHACGGGPTVAVLDAACRLGASRARVLRYADSGDVSGDKTSVVGYMAAAVW